MTAAVAAGTLPSTDCVAPRVHRRRPPPAVVLVAAWLVAGCQPTTVQKEFRVVERWSGRWCADASHERLDGCSTSQDMAELVGALAALQGGARPPGTIDPDTATRTCLAADARAIVALDPLLSDGARVVVRGEGLERYAARTSPEPGGKAYHLLQCHFRTVVLEGPVSLFGGRR